MLWGTEPYKFLWAATRASSATFISSRRISAGSIHRRPVPARRRLGSGAARVDPRSRPCHLSVRRWRSHVKTAVASAIAKAHDHGLAGRARRVSAARHRLSPRRRGLRRGSAKVEMPSMLTSLAMFERHLDCLGRSFPLHHARRDRRSPAERAALRRAGRRDHVRRWLSGCVRAGVADSRSAKAFRRRCSSSPIWSGDPPGRSTTSCTTWSRRRSSAGTTRRSSCSACCANSVCPPTTSRARSAIGNSDARGLGTAAGASAGGHPAA